MENKQRLTSLILTVVLLGLNLGALNYLLAGWSGARLDLTEEGIFSISPATRRILETLDEDVTIYGYFSQRTHPKLAPLVPEINDLLEEYRVVSRGRVQVEIIDPGEDEAAEEEAADRFGVRSTPFRLASKYETGIVNAYFALIIRYGDQYERYGFQDLIEVEPLPDGDIDVKLRNLEYDLTRAIKKVVFGFRGSNELFERVEEPVRLIAIVSPEQLPDFLAEVPEALRMAAEQLGEKGGDKFVFEEFDPTTDESVLPQLESRFGPIRPMTASFFGEDSFYLYGLLEISGRLEQIVLTGESVSAASIREAVEDSLRRHTPGFLKTVGIFTSDPPDIPPQIRMQLQMPPQAPPEFETVKRYLRQDYHITDVDLNSSGVPTNVDVLLVLKPTDLSEQQLYALDQYLMRGGRVIVCAGSYTADYTASGLNVAPLNTGLDDWLAHHGITVGRTLVLDDVNQVMPIPEVRYTSLGAMRTISLVPYPYLVHVQGKGFLNHDITANLDSVGIYWGSPVTVDEEVAAGVEVLPILQSSDRSWTSDDLGRIAELEYFVPEEGLAPQLLAVALAGRFESYYRDHPVPGADSEATPPEPPPIPLEQSPDTRLVIVGNAAFISDFVERALGQIDNGFFVENLRFVENLIDWSTQDNDLMSIRSQGVVSRRLDVIEKSSEMTLEAINYVLPVVALIGLGWFLNYRRRRAVPTFATATRPTAAAGPSRHEVNS